MTEFEMQDIFYWHLSRKQHSCIVPNVFAYAWESDILSITKSGIVHEYEIKVSLSDFRKDSDKADKHEILKTGSRNLSDYEKRFIDNGSGVTWCDYDPASKRVKHRRPNYFYYACPQNLIPASEVPEHAGLIYLSDKYSLFEFVKPAPILHKEKVEDKIKQHIITSFMFKYWKLRLQQERQRNGKDN